MGILSLSTKDIGGIFSVDCVAVDFKYLATFLCRIASELLDTCKSLSYGTQAIVQVLVPVVKSISSFRSSVYDEEVLSPSSTVVVTFLVRHWEQDMATTPLATTTGLHTTDKIVLDSDVVQQHVMFPDDGDGSDTESSDHQESSTNSSDKYGTVELAINESPLEGDVGVGGNSEGILTDVVEVASVAMDASALSSRQPHPEGMLENHSHRFCCTSLENPASRGERATCSSVDRETLDNAFGIAYQPHGLNFAKTEGYNLPAGPAFVDEDEFEAQLSSEFDVAQKRIARGSPQSCLGTPATERKGGRKSDLEAHTRDNDGAGANGFEDNTAHTESSNVHDERVPIQAPWQPRVVAQQAVATDSLLGTSGGDDRSRVQKQPDKERALIQTFDLQVEGSKALELLAGAYQAGGAVTKVRCNCVAECNGPRHTAGDDANDVGD